MTTFIQANGQQIRFMDKGTGSPLVLLHGFTESLEIWEDFANALEKDFRVIAIDLPGHGQTGQFGQSHSMELMADVVKLVLDHLSVGSCVMIGHSMGGYVTLSFAEKYPHLVRAIGLFHSQAGADSEEARKNRVRMINILYSNRTGFIRQFIPELFAPDNVPHYQEAIARLQELALLPPPEGIVAALRGMMERDDKTAFLSQTGIPVLFIAGKADLKIPLDLVLRHAALPDNAEVVILGNAGHMGFIEERDKTLQSIRYFAHRAHKIGDGYP